MRADDTIFALSSGSLPAGLAVIRLSGPRAIEVAEQIAGPVSTARQAILRPIKAADGAIIDHGLVIAFPKPRSFTGEDCVELHLHGSRAVVAAVYDVLMHMGLRLAEAGEFSRRALENGKLDLVEAEGLSDLLQAETEMQRRLAIELAEGGLSNTYRQWALELTHARALIEAELDFADEDDVPGAVSDRIWPQMVVLKQRIDAQLRATETAAIIRDGFHVAIVGPPNAGKSSLLNALAGQDVAIVTDVPGTTRDILHIDLDIEGYLVRFMDTAGIRDTSDVVEREGIRRARLAAERADLVLRLGGLEATLDFAAQTVPVWDVITKIDLYPDATVSGEQFPISAITGDGLENLKAAIGRTVAERWSPIAALKPGRMRHVQLLGRASNFIGEALKGTQLELRAESLRLAAEELSRITGHVDVEHLLDIIFSEFCIGK